MLNVTGFNFIAACIDMSDQSGYKKAFLQYYLETHPVHGQKPVTKELVEKWLLGTTKMLYVSN